MLRETLAKNVKLWRDRRKITQEELASLCMEISETGALSNRSYISDIETCRRNITLDRVEILAKALRIKPYELFLDEELTERI